MAVLDFSILPTAEGHLRITETVLDRDGDRQTERQRLTLTHRETKTDGETETDREMETDRLRNRD